ncbi:hypothetical protein [Pimelobacter simplex]|uniref:hypothetical protein n=1 Tax=Nocardioides simplex TaxID=2045 RepID=UPI003AAB6F92
MFCFAERGGHIQRSAEHFLSRPVAKAFGIDRDDGEVYRFGADGKDVRTVRLNGLKRRCVCADCNNGWMNQLEHDMAKVAAWFAAGDTELGGDLDIALRRWALTRHVILSELDGNAAQFGATDHLSDDYVVPLSSLARAVYENDLETIRGAAIGISRSSAGYEFAWAFGHPTVLPSDRPQLGRFGAATILTLGAAQFWICAPTVFEHEVYAPAGVHGSSPSLTSGQLPGRDGLPSSRDITVEFKDVEQTAEVLGYLATLTEDELLALAQDRDRPPTL